MSPTGSPCVVRRVIPTPVIAAQQEHLSYVIMQKITKKLIFLTLYLTKQNVLYVLCSEGHLEMLIKILCRYYCQFSYK